MTWFNGLLRYVSITEECTAEILPFTRFKDLAKEDLETFIQARKAIWSAARPILGEVMRFTITQAAEALQACPIPALAPAASILLTLWAALDNIKVNVFTPSKWTY